MRWAQIKEMEVKIEKRTDSGGSSSSCWSRKTTDRSQRVCEDVAISPSKKLRNAIAGFVARLTKRIQQGSVARGGERKKETYVPEVSALDQEIIEVDPDTQEMLKLLDFGSLSNLQVTQPTAGMNFKTPRGAV
ncbi:small ribosomal subunit protein eS17-like [Lycaon pictus]